MGDVANEANGVKVYVAGAWTEQWLRARPWMDRLQQAGVAITHDWTVLEGTVIRNDETGEVATSVAGLSPRQRWRYAQQNLNGVLEAGVLWHLAPASGSRSRWVDESARQARGYGDTGARAMRTRRPTPRIIESGPAARGSIFTELAEVFPTDGAAFSAVLAYAKGTASPGSV